jgi:hypothetical protein
MAAPGSGIHHTDLFTDFLRPPMEGVSRLPVGVFHLQLQNFLFACDSISVTFVRKSKRNALKEGKPLGGPQDGGLRHNIG